MNCDRCKTPLSGGVDTFGGVNAAPDGSPLFSTLCAACHFKTEFPAEIEKEKPERLEDEDNSDEYEPGDFGSPEVGKRRFVVSVDVVVNYSRDIYVWASDKDEAEDLARDEYDHHAAGGDAGRDGDIDRYFRAQEVAK